MPGWKLPQRTLVRSYGEAGARFPMQRPSDRGRPIPSSFTAKPLARVPLVSEKGEKASLIRRAGLARRDMAAGQRDERRARNTPDQGCGDGWREDQILLPRLVQIRTLPFLWISPKFSDDLLA